MPRIREIKSCPRCGTPCNKTNTACSHQRAVNAWVAKFAPKAK